MSWRWRTSMRASDRIPRLNASVEGLTVSSPRGGTIGADPCDAGDVSPASAKMGRAGSSPGDGVSK
ncbi:MAG: hypothetical protein ABI903_03425 [Actinomycetota bacterium]